ncbi:MAG: two-component system, OmpR family, phosphate regulon sensor histidine kinase PhoR [Chloroflexi bacterium]|jgi:two-component system phosphate regulon sensor histidine kinase PhoR|nr:MAG: two-component system, OmpR family, phosphate regulon sensor histidine kinase PhoR [Chloroflexota bacterium]
MIDGWDNWVNMLLKISNLYLLRNIVILVLVILILIAILFFIAQYFPDLANLFVLIFGILLISVISSVVLNVMLVHQSKSSVKEVRSSISGILGSYPEYPVSTSESNSIDELTGVLDEFSLVMSEKFNSLSSEKNTLSALLDTMGDGVIVTDEDSVITLFNRTAQGIFNLEYSNCIGLRVAEVIRDFQIIQLHSNCSIHREVRQAEIEIPEIRRYLSVTATPLGDQSDEGVLMNIHDLTNIRLLENTRKEFVSNVSHELRSPLASVKALVGTLRGGALQDSKVASDFVERIDRDVDRMTLLVADLLELSRLESGREEWVKETLQIQDVIRESISIVINQIGQDLPIQSIADPELKVIGNEEKITQILVNLLENAVKFTPSNGNVTINAREKGVFLEVSVRDTGIGIAPEHLPHLFERFYKVDRSRRAEGTGLGLAIVKHIVQAHGGEAYADSIEGEGSTFYFTLPVP